MRTLASITLLAVTLLLTGCINFGARFKAESHIEQSINHLPASGVRVETKNGRIVIKAGPEAGGGRSASSPTSRLAGTPRKRPTSACD